MSSFNFYYKCYTTSSSNQEKRPTSKKLYTNDSQDVYRKGGKNKKSGWGGGEERINPCKNCTLSQQEFQRGAYKKEKNMARTGITTILL
jgi:hypothetical protein